MSAPDCAVFGGGDDQPLCPTIRELAAAMRERTGNLPPLYGIFPDYFAPIVRNQLEGRELMMARWGMPSPVFALRDKKSDPVSPMSVVPNLRIGGAGSESRTAASENEVLSDGSRPTRGRRQKTSCQLCPGIRQRDSGEPTGAPSTAPR
jgi:hypothetical protein